MRQSYPYRSRLKATLEGSRRGRDYFVWQDDLKRRTAKARGPVVEIGGPTDTGYFFLDRQPLPSKVVITNISDDPTPYDRDAKGLAAQVVEKVDGTNMPYADESVGIFLMAAMSYSSDWWVGLDAAAKEKAEPKFTAESVKARLEMGLVAAGVLRPEDAKHAQRVRIYREVYRVLRKGGLFFTDGTIEEIMILQKLGFELVALVEYVDDSQASGLSYEFAVEKK